MILKNSDSRRRHLNSVSARSCTACRKACTAQSHSCGVELALFQSVKILVLELPGIVRWSDPSDNGKRKKPNSIMRDGSCCINSGLTCPKSSKNFSTTHISANRLLEILSRHPELSDLHNLTNRDK